MKHFRWLLAVVLGLAILPLAAQDKLDGYIELEDGIGLKYTVLLPAGEGPFPVLLQYQGYGAGADPNDNGLVLISGPLLAEGYALLGVSLRGTGCSEGDFDLFESQWVEDGLQVIDWAARQDWSNGNLAMIGLSFPGMTQMMVGPRRPPALKALMPWSAMTDLYRDVGYPGGIFNASFASAWTGIQKSGYTDTPVEVSEGDTRCLVAIADHNEPEQIVFLAGQTHPWADHHFYERFVPEGTIGKIDVPVLFSHAWQDEQISSRTLIDYEQLDPARTWHVYGNGVHGFGLGSSGVIATMSAFLERFLKGVNNSFEATPRVQIHHEVAFGAEPAWVSHHPSWPVPIQPAELYFHADGSLQAQRPEARGSLDYAYPLPAPSMTSALAADTENQSYELPVPDGGAAVFTTPPLTHDLELLGPSRVDLWFSSSASDTDLQLSLSEIRPDGREMFVQRGWLRASQRQMDLRHNRVNAPYHTHREADARPLPEEAVRLSVEIWPVGHVFRAGSSLRLSVEAPVGTTGFRQLEFNPLPALNTVHTGGEDPSRIVLSVLPLAQAGAPLHDCRGIANQPCRDSQHPVPSGSLTVPAATAARPAISGRVQVEGDSIRIENRSAQRHYLRAVHLDLDAPEALDAVILHADGQRQRIEQPFARARFELQELVLAPGQSLSLSVEADRRQAAPLASLANLAHAGGGPGGAAAGLPALLWLLALPLLAWQGRRRALLALGLCGVLVACSGGREGPEAVARDAATPVFQLGGVEIVDGQGRYQRYALR